jgi:hypothetical protein
MEQVTFSFDFEADKKAPLFAQYDGQMQPQPAYIEVKPEARTVSADWSGEIGNAVPVTVWNNQELRFPVPANVRGSALIEFCEEHKADFARICDGYSEEWDGSNYVGRYTKDAQDAQETIENAIERDLNDVISIEKIGIYLAEGGASLADEWPEGKSLKEAAAALYDEVKAEEAEDWEIIGDADDVADYLRNRMDDICGQIPAAYKEALKEADGWNYDEDDFADEEA